MKHKSFAAVGAVIFVYMSCGLAMASDDRKDGCLDCKTPLRETCFNLYCTYENQGDQGPKGCRVAAVFNKNVTDEGDEVRDRSRYPNNPAYQVECDGQVIFNGPGLRYTDEQGTRIQATTGPYPAVLLPRGALRDGHRYVQSALDLHGVGLRGYCYIYTGRQ